MCGSELKYLIILAFLLTHSRKLDAQDLIITIFNDSIHCKVDKTTDTFIYYRTKKTKRNSFDIVSRKEVGEVIYNFENSSIPPGRNRKYALFQIFGTFTGSRMLSQIPRNLPNEFEEYLDQLKWGLGYSAGVNMMFSETMGLGVLYSQTEYNNSVEVMQVGTGVTGELSDNISLSYYAANYTYQGSVQNSETYIQLNVGLGYLRYKNEAKTIYSYLVEGSSVGGHLFGSANFSLGSGIFVPVQFGIKGFSVRNLSVSFPEELPDEFREGITFDVMNNEPFMLLRLELSVGLLISF